MSVFKIYVDMDKREEGCKSSLDPRSVRLFTDTNALTDLIRLEGVCFSSEISVRNQTAIQRPLPLMLLWFEFQVPMKIAM